MYFNLSQVKKIVAKADKQLRHMVTANQFFPCLE